MIAVIQCAATKRAGAGTLVTAAGRPVRFVADPTIAPRNDKVVYARPDEDRSDGDGSWRQVLLTYNKEELDNPLGLLPAGQLYSHPVYARLVGQLGGDNVYILSAGWGLISASFLTPDYDITFSNAGEPYTRRRQDDRCMDFRMLPDDRREPVVFFGGKSYLRLFRTLTASSRAPRTVFYNAQVAPPIAGVTLKRFDTRARTNWHYECANAFLDGLLQDAVSR